MIVAWEPKALTAAQLFAKEDREGVLAVFDATDALAADPRPSGSVSYGENLHRLRIGRYRVWYEIKDAEVEIAVFHLGRSGA